MLSNLRDVKHVAEARRRCFQKAGVAGVDGINVMMELVRTSVDEEVEALPRSQSAPPGPRSRGQDRREVLRSQSADGLGAGDDGAPRTPRRAPTRAPAKRDKNPDPE
eukprot:2818211-Pyramimonas_sp.AAC.1